MKDYLYFYKGDLTYLETKKIICVKADCRTIKLYLQVHYSIFQVQYFNNIAVRADNFIGFHYDSSSTSVMRYSYATGPGTEFLDTHGYNRYYTATDLNLSPGSLLDSTSGTPMRRVPLAHFYVSLKGIQF